MRVRTLALLAASLLALCACEKGKTRHLPHDPFAGPPPAAAPEAPPTEGQSAGLTRRTERAGFFLDHIGQAVDPYTRRPAITAASQPIVLDGFGFDLTAKAPARGVDVVIDGKAYGTAYGRPRGDVATYFKNPALSHVGFRTVLPPGTLAVGAHTAIVRVISADGTGYYDSPAVAFEVQ